MLCREIFGIHLLDVTLFVHSFWIALERAKKRACQTEIDRPLLSTNCKLNPIALHMSILLIWVKKKASTQLALILIKIKSSRVRTGMRT